MKMIRTAIQWLIAQKVDDGVSLGVFLSWVVRRDRLSRQYYEGLLRLRERLSADVVTLLGDAAPETGTKPLRILSRSVLFAGSAASARRRSRQRTRNSFAAVSLLLALGAGVFLSSRFFPDGAIGHAVASPSSKTVSGTITLDDPLIRDELVRLCRQSPNESGPFFLESIR